MTPGQTITQIYQMQQLQAFSITLKLQSKIQAQNSKIYQLERLIINLLAFNNQTGKNLTSSQGQPVACEQQMAGT